MTQKYEDILAELKTCAVHRRPQLLAELSACSNQSKPGKKLTADEKFLVDDLRKENLALFKADSWNNAKVIAANLRVIKFIEGE